MTTNGSDCQVAIIGAGPYGLAAASHLQAAGVTTRIFGEPMEFWDRQMPAGMLLRSSEPCSQIADPDGRLTIAAFRRAHGVSPTRPVPLTDFVGYGRWYQRQAVPGLVRQRVVRVEQRRRGFRLVLADGLDLTAERVVVATGIGPFAWRPPEFEGLSPKLASHTLDAGDLARFAGRRVVVVGGGQSALESAALLRECGAAVEVLVRAPTIRWLRMRDQADDGPLLRRLRRRAGALLRPLVRPDFDIMGPRFVSWLIAAPRVYRRAPSGLRRLLTSAAVRPAGAGWLVRRLDGVPITTGTGVRRVAPVNAHVRLELSDGTSRDADHVLLGTGYRVDVQRYAFLAPGVRDMLAVQDGYPVLRPGFESSVPGLHFVGTPAAATFGPVCRFVVGTRYVARRLAHAAQREVHHA